MWHVFVDAVRAPGRIDFIVLSGNIEVIDGSCMGLNLDLHSEHLDHVPSACIMKLPMVKSARPIKMRIVLYSKEATRSPPCCAAFADLVAACLSVHFAVELSSHVFLVD